MNLNCPHCGMALESVAMDPLSDWAGANLYICFNDACIYFVNSWATMRRQGWTGGYRYYYSENGNQGAILIADENSYRDRIVEWFDYADVHGLEPCQREPESDIRESLARLERKLDQLIMLHKEK